MASDSEEDELLQMALKEQAQRDVRPSSSKHVVNLIQPPPPPPFEVKNQQQRGNPNPRRPTPPHSRVSSRGGDDDDEDSEVEMLSISSGDEDSSSREIAIRQQQKNRVRRPSRDGGDRGDDSGEPGTWKRVDEAELARRVREMRETRAAPATQTIDPKAARGLTNLQSLPRGVEVLDPLGLGVMDNKSLRLITDSSVSSPVSREKSDLLDPDNREKVIYSSPKFDAKVFLSRVHQETSAADLESGALTLKTDLKGRTQQKKKLVKENFDCFVSCKTTIDDIESKLRQIEEDPEGAGTARLHGATERISEMANHAFQPLFERQVQAEKIRSVQGMLQRFRTLFNLPSTIRGSISKGEYDVAVREYRKAKSIVLPSHVGILKRVLEEVEKVMNEFRGMLYKSMEDPQLDLAELENTVRLLLELEPDSDPVWHYLHIQNRRVRSLLEKCTVEHEARMEVLHNKMQERLQSDARWRQLQQESNKSLDVDSSLRDSGDSETIDFIGEESDALRGRYIRQLTAVLIQHVPAFWRLALSVFSGKFSKVNTGNALIDSEVNAKSGLNKNEEKGGDLKYSSHSLEEVAEMVRGTISAYEVKVHSTFRDFEGSNILCPNMSDAIREIAKACLAFEGKESAPPVAVKSLHVLQFEITKIHILRLCTWMRATTEEISKEEVWIPLSTLERNKSPYAISYLPLAFQAMTMSAMNQIDIMLQNLRSESTKLENMYGQLQEIQESVRIAFLNCFVDFAGYLERIGSELSESRSNKESHFQNGYMQGFESELPGVHSGGAVGDSQKKLLIILSNIGYCKDELCRGLYNKYKHMWLQDREKDEEYADIQDLVTSFSRLEEKILECYAYAKGQDSRNIESTACYLRQLNYEGGLGVNLQLVDTVFSLLKNVYDTKNRHVGSYFKESTERLAHVMANFIRIAAANYLLDSGVLWGGAPAVKGIRDATLELLHYLVSVHAEVFSGAKPLLEKILGILVEGLIDTFLSLFHEHKAKDLKFDANDFCQLMLELEYFETVLHAYFSPEAHEALKSLQGLLLEKACESSSEPNENPGHHRRSTRGSEDAMADEKQQAPSVSPDDLLAQAHELMTEVLEGEMERTRLNIACFMEASLEPNSSPNYRKPASPGFSRRPR